MVPGSRIQPAAVASCEHKLQCLRVRVRQISRERDRARLDLEEAERRCLQLSRQLDEQRAARKDSQGSLRKIKTEMKTKDLLLQQATQRQAKLEADAQLLQGREANLQGRLNLTMKENTQLQNKLMKMSEKLSATEKLVLELQKELDLIVKDKLGQAELCSAESPGQHERFAEIILEYERQCQRVKVLWSQNNALRRELERLRLLHREREAQACGAEQVRLSPRPPVPHSTCAGTALTMQQLQDQLQDLKVQLETKVNHYQQEMELMRNSFERDRKASEEKFQAEMTKVEEQKKDLEERAAKYWAIIDGLREQRCVWSPEPEEEFEQEQAEAEQQHTRGLCRMEQPPAREGDELLTQHGDRRSLRATGHTPVHQQSQRLRALETRPEQEQHPGQAAGRPGATPEQLDRAKGEPQRQPQPSPREQQRRRPPKSLQCWTRRPGRRPAQAPLIATARSQLLLGDVREGQEPLAQALQVAQLERKRTEDKNRALEGQVAALKQLIEEMAPASLSV